MYKEEDLKKIFEGKDYFFGFGREFYLGAMGLRYLLEINGLEKKIKENGK